MIATFVVSHAPMRSLVILGAVVVGLFSSAALASGVVRTVALTGQPAPGTGTNFLSIAAAPVVINDSGHAAVQAVLSGNGFSRGIWSEASGALQLVALTGTAVPGPPNGLTFSSMGPIVVTNPGDTVFWALAGGLREGLFLKGGGPTVQIVLDGAPAPGTPNGVRFEVISPFPSVTDDGRVAFWGGVSGTGVDANNTVAVWSQGSGVLSLLARAGNQPPGVPSGVRYENLGSPDLNNPGHSVFFATLTGGGVNDTNDRGIWSDRTGTVQLVVRSGNPAHNLPDVIYTSLRDAPHINDAGQIAFLATLTGVDVDSTNDQGIWVEQAGGFAPAVRSGAHASGTPAGVNFGPFERFLLNEAGQIAFIAGLAGAGVDDANNLGVWFEGAGGLTLAARRGEQAPGAPMDVVFDGLGGLAYNDAGQVAFFATLTGSGVDDSNNEGIWATNRAGQLHLIARMGEMLEVGPGDSRMITDLQLGSTLSFNNPGQVAFRAVFADGSSGAFVSSLVAVPEPAAAVLAALAFAVLVKRNRW